MIYDIYIYIYIRIQNNEYVYFSFTAQSAFCSSENMVGCPTMTAVFFLEPFWHIKIWWKSCVHPQSLGWICAIMLLEKKKRVDLYESKRRNPGFGCFQKWGGKPQNGWWKPWKSLFLNGWFGEKTYYFRKTSICMHENKKDFQRLKKRFLGDPFNLHTWRSNGPSPPERCKKGQTHILWRTAMNHNRPPVAGKINIQPQRKMLE